jgi:hypothetical protein
VLITVGNRVPFSVTVRGTRSILDGKKMPNDGLQFLRLLWQRRNGPRNSGRSILPS